MQQRNASIRLTSRDISELQTALETILTPISHSTPEEWGAAVMRDVRTLLRADQMLFALPLDGQVRIAGLGDRTEEAARQYNHEYWRTDFVVSLRRKELGLEVYHRDQLYKPGELGKDVLHNEWCVPNKLYDTLGMGVQVSDTTIPAGVHAYHDKATRPEFGARGQALLNLLLPAFRASVRSYALLVKHRDSMGRLIDSIPVGVCLVDADGSITHVNVALANLREAEQDWRPVEAAIRRAAHALAASLHARKSTFGLPAFHASERVQTTTSAYEVHATGAREFPPLPDTVGLVFLQVVEDEACIRQRHARTTTLRFRLTRRETQILPLLIDRLHATEIAQILGISMHTVRHHTESIYSKTGVRSRSELAALCSAERSR